MKYSTKLRLYRQALQSQHTNLQTRRAGDKIFQLSAQDYTKLQRNCRQREIQALGKIQVKCCSMKSVFAGLELHSTRCGIHWLDHISGAQHCILNFKALHTDILLHISSIVQNNAFETSLAGDSRVVPNQLARTLERCPNPKLLKEKCWSATFFVTQNVSAHQSSVHKIIERTGCSTQSLVFKGPSFKGIFAGNWLSGVIKLGWTMRRLIENGRTEIARH